MVAVRIPIVAADIFTIHLSNAEPINHALWFWQLGQLFLKIGDRYPLAWADSVPEAFPWYM